MKEQILLNISFLDEMNSNDMETMDEVQQIYDFFVSRYEMVTLYVPMHDIREDEKNIESVEQQNKLRVMHGYMRTSKTGGATNW